MLWKHDCFTRVGRSEKRKEKEAKGKRTLASVVLQACSKLRTKRGKVEQQQQRAKVNEEMRKRM
jgi:hypothetical protein